MGRMDMEETLAICEAYLVGHTPGARKLGAHLLRIVGSPLHTHRNLHGGLNPESVPSIRNADGMGRIALSFPWLP